MRLRRVPTCGSTNDLVREAALSGEPEGLVVVAGQQEMGRGRRGRTWISPPGNLYSSFLLRPDAPTAEAAKLSFVACLAVADAVATLVPAPAPQITCKWPNDVLVAGAKISGILLESASEAGGRVGFVVAGIGVNVGFYPEGQPYPVTSLREQGSRASVDATLSALAAALAHWYEIWREQGFSPVRKAWLGRADGIGQSIRVRLGTEDVVGRFETMDEDGNLVMVDALGQSRRIAAGDVFRA